MDVVAAASIPVTTRQAYKILDDMLTDEEIRAALSQTKDEFASNEHFGLGLWIRNNWIYGGEDDDECLTKRRLNCVAMLTGHNDEEFAFFIPDMISNEFLKKYYDHLKRMSKK